MLKKIFPKVCKSKQFTAFQFHYRTPTKIDHNDSSKFTSRSFNGAWSKVSNPLSRLNTSWLLLLGQWDGPFPMSFPFHSQDATSISNRSQPKLKCDWYVSFQGLCMQLEVIFCSLQHFRLVIIGLFHLLIMPSNGIVLINFFLFMENIFQVVLGSF